MGFPILFYTPSFLECGSVRCIPCGGSLALPLLTLQIIAHPTPDCNRQNAQNRDFYFLDICATFLLTNCWRCVIMEISRPAFVGAPLKMPLIVNKKAHRFCKPKPKAVGKIISNCMAVWGATPYFHFITPLHGTRYTDLSKLLKLLLYISDNH